MIFVLCSTTDRKSIAGYQKDKNKLKIHGDLSNFDQSNFEYLSIAWSWVAYKRRAL